MDKKEKVYVYNVILLSCIYFLTVTFGIKSLGIRSLRERW